jgi:hypothetical protein
LYYLNSLNVWRGCCLPPRMGFPPPRVQV